MTVVRATAWGGQMTDAKEWEGGALRSPFEALASASGFGARVPSFLGDSVALGRARPSLRKERDGQSALIAMPTSTWAADGESESGRRTEDEVEGRVATRERDGEHGDGDVNSQCGARAQAVGEEAEVGGGG
ncbi:hypothetical protein K523DRAFT_359208 [Schizophyllum commune Tattone D]|nr:hypothetical protein K523DRAFT_359208 [Schizophyllum commune Tattone D]